MPTTKAGQRKALATRATLYKITYEVRDANAPNGRRAVSESNVPYAKLDARVVLAMLRSTYIPDTLVVHG
jgi:hypothetical protein